LHPLLKAVTLNTLNKHQKVLSNNKQTKNKFKYFFEKSLVLKKEILPLHSQIKRNENLRITGTKVLSYFKINQIKKNIFF